MVIIRILVLTGLLIGGIIAASDMLKDKFKLVSKIKDMFGKWEQVLGVALILLGIFKIFLPEGTSSWSYQLVRQYFIGDLFPMLGCIILGVVLSAELIGKLVPSSGDMESGIISFSKAIRVPIGLAAIVIAILHNFLFDVVLF